LGAGGGRGSAAIDPAAIAIGLRAATSVAVNDGTFQDCARVISLPESRRPDVAHQFLTLTIDVLERLLPAVLDFEPAVRLVELESGPGVFDRVVRAATLDVGAKDDISQEAQRELALPGGEMIDVDGVDDLRPGNVDVCASSGIIP
jgi:hypothetical protein